MGTAPEGRRSTTGCTASNIDVARERVGRSSAQGEGRVDPETETTQLRSCRDNRSRSNPTLSVGPATACHIVSSAFVRLRRPNNVAAGFFVVLELEQPADRGLFQQTVETLEAVVSLVESGIAALERLLDHRAPDLFLVAALGGQGIEGIRPAGRAPSASCRPSPSPPPADFGSRRLWLLSPASARAVFLGWRFGGSLRTRSS